jgi:hypothetical protein
VRLFGREAIDCEGRHVHSAGKTVRILAGSTVIAYEMGYRKQLASKWWGFGSNFYNDYNHMRSTSATRTTAYNIVPEVFKFDPRLSWHATRRLEFSIVARNLFGKVAWGN